LELTNPNNTHAPSLQYIPKQTQERRIMPERRIHRQVVFLQLLSGGVDSPLDPKKARVDFQED
jgi:hypothetical protein